MSNSDSHSKKTQQFHEQAFVGSDGSTEHISTAKLPALLLRWQEQETEREECLCLCCSLQPSAGAVTQTSLTLQQCPVVGLGQNNGNDIKENPKLSLQEQAI